MSSVRRRGRRPAGKDTKNALLTAGLAVFNEVGYEKATVRAIAARAGVDPAMVNHWFGGKEGLFAAAVRLPVNPNEIIEAIIEGPIEEMAERIVRRFLTVWDTAGGGVFTALVRSISSHRLAADLLRGLFVQVIFTKVLARTRADRPELRASLCATQMIGLGMLRYVLVFEPIASADHDTLVAVVAPTLRRYLIGELTDVTTGLNGP
jgi:AcrR family transcriptional regulator